MARASQYKKVTDSSTVVSFSMNRALQNLGVSEPSSASSFSVSPVKGHKNVINCPYCGKFTRVRGGGLK